jgi:hypothetical protein
VQMLRPRTLGHGEHACSTTCPNTIPGTLFLRLRACCRDILSAYSFHSLIYQCVHDLH